MAGITTRHTPEGVRYRARVRLKGHPPQSATFIRLTDAKRWKSQTEAAIREGRYFHSTESRRHTLAEAVDRYIEHVLPHKSRNKSAASYARVLTWWKGRLGSYSLNAITPALLIQCRDDLLGGITSRGRNTKQKYRRGPATVNRYFAYLGSLLSTAEREWGWLEMNPVRKVSKLREPRGRERFLSDEERKRLLDTCKQNPDLYALVILALCSGMRKGEMLGLRWADIDFPTGTIRLRETKNGHGRLVPLVEPALSVLKERARVRRINCDFVFPSPRENRPWAPWSSWYTAIEKAGLEDFHFHDLRHSAASMLARAGLSPSELAAALGHRSLSMVQRYAHLSDAHLSERMASAMKGMLNEKAS